MRFELFIAARYLRAKRRQAVVGVITLISVIGVAAGVASLIIALAITNGMRRDLQEKLVGSTAHVMLMRLAGDGMRDWRPLLERLRRLPHVTAAAPGLYEEVLIARGAKSGGALIDGIVPKDQATVSDIMGKMEAGSAKELEGQRVSGSAGQRVSDPGIGEQPTLHDEAVKDGPPDSGGTPGLGGTPGVGGIHRVGGTPGVGGTPDSGGTPGVGTGQDVPAIVIGKDLAESLGAGVGDTVEVISPQGELTPLGIVPKYEGYRVTGIFKSGFYQYDSSYAFIRLADAQRLFSEPDLISAISFKVDDMYKADVVGREIEEAAGTGFQTTNWMEQNRELFRALETEQVVTFVILALIVFVAALNILIALTMMVMEKTKDIAVLMSFGVRVDQVRGIFLLQGVLISAIGTAIGLVVGYGVSLVGSHYHFIRLDASVYSIDYLPFAPLVWHGAIVAGVSLGISLVATLYPSWSAAKVLPAEALRYE